MTTELKDYYKRLIEADKVSQVEEVLDQIESEYADRLSWVPVGGKENNSGPIQVSSDEGRSLIERVTNGVDAILEREHDEHKGIPDCRTPKEAAYSWLSIPIDRGLSALSQVQRREMAVNNLIVRLLPGEDKNSRIVEAVDNGTGISAEEIPKTILSLNESNKIRKYYLCGIYGQGGSSTFAISKYTLIVSKVKGVNKIAFSVVTYVDLPPEEYKSGHYAYLVIDEKIPEIEAERIESFERGTMVKHFGYQLDKYNNPVGPRSVYGLLNRMLFDPIVPVWLEDRIHNYNRVIKGSRNALNGAIDESDEERTGPALLHHTEMFYARIADFGQIGIEYWVLQEPNRTDAYINPTHPIILTLNGQNHGEFGKWIIKDEAGLPYLSTRTIVHINCDGISSEGKRQLFVSTREGSRGGVVEGMIIDEIIRALKSDDKLNDLNNEIMQTTVYERSEDDARIIRREVAKILNMQGVPVDEGMQGAVSTNPGMGAHKGGGHHSHRLRNIDLKDPPTYIKILWNDQPIKFFPGQRRYIRVETDAPSNYYDVSDPSRTRINIIVEGLTHSGSVPLQNGRMRIIAEANSSAVVGAKGKIRVELTRSGMPVLFDEKEVEIINIPPSAPRPTVLTLPDFETIPINRESPMWDTLDWPDEVDDIASQTINEEGTYKIYYSTEFPVYQKTKEMFERRKVDLGQLFTKRYEIWISAYALLYEKDQEEGEKGTQDSRDELEEDTKRRFEMKEKCRAAIIATQFATKEVEQLRETSIPV